MTKLAFTGTFKLHKYKLFQTYKDLLFYLKILYAILVWHEEYPYTRKTVLSYPVIFMQTVLLPVDVLLWLCELQNVSKDYLF